MIKRNTKLIRQAVNTRDVERILGHELLLSDLIQILFYHASPGGGVL